MKSITPQRHILVVEDDGSLRSVLCTLLEAEGFQVTPCVDAEGALTALKRSSFDCVLSDFKLPKKNGLDLLEQVRELSMQVPFIMMTAFGSVDLAVMAMKNGANDFITKPIDPDTLSNLIRQVVRHRQIVDRKAGGKASPQQWFLTENEKTTEILAQARKVARVDTPVLILGESGTGKEVLARFIHDQSPRRDKPFIAVNCAAIPANLLESEFFGHEAGAFTGATQKRIGVLEFASEGTLFLDEIGEMPLAMQVKLLRALQEGEIRRVGGSQAISVSPRILSATNRDIQQAIQNGSFRDDFYYRIAVLELEIPPLRERREDIPVLVNHYLKKACEEIGRSTLSIDKAAREVLEHYAWPGNARELENTIERAVVMADHCIETRHLELSKNQCRPQRTLSEVAQAAVEHAEREAITAALIEVAGNKGKAAELLGVSYKTLLSKIKLYRLAQVQPDEMSSEHQVPSSKTP